MGVAAIRICKLGKQYRIGLREPPPSSAAQALRRVLAAPWRRLKALSGRGGEREQFWALRDVSFDVQPGEIVGIIGRNGAGKSTLLKILSRVTEPTEGVAHLRGRVASLLEVGTGFHPELTGRENIYLNGAILGMRRGEIARRFEQIAAFAEIDPFLDTPVKRYSSGMRVRLGFAIAAHLESEILIVDEVLAVGDAQFQRKCLGKMSAVGQQGRTVLFVSHNLTAVRNLCTRAIWLSEGRLVADGEPAAVAQQYLGTTAVAIGVPELDLRGWLARRGSGEARFLHARLLSEDGAVCGVFNRLDPMVIEFTFESCRPSALNLSATCTTADDGIKVLQLAHQDSPGFSPGVVCGRRTVRVRIPALPLQSGRYEWNLSIHTNALVPVDCVQGVLTFVVEDDLTRSPRPYQSTRHHGLCTLLAEWRYVETEQPVHAVQPA